MDPCTDHCTSPPDATASGEGLSPRPPDPTGRHPRISVQRAIQGGLPVIRGTRITVDAICGLVERGAPVDEILEEYPALTQADVSAALLYDSERRS